tara:strand:- start:882 stop:1082 length:201 start_codon:yes stop_codon:yes gene_type:complete
MDDLKIKIKILEDDIATLKNLRGSEVTMNEELKAYNKKLELSVESLIKINDQLLDRVIKLRELLLK